MTMLELQYVSQKLLSARSLELAVPGTYRVNGAMVRIRHFLPTVQVLILHNTHTEYKMKCTIDVTSHAQCVHYCSAAYLVAVWQSCCSMLALSPLRT
jgi:hypothetical protein